MRPFEILLSVANLLTFFLLVVPLRGRARWTRHSALIALLAMGAQLLVEVHAGRWSQPTR